LNRPAVQCAAFGRSVATRLDVGLRQRWEKDHPAAAKLNALVGLVVVDDRGIHVLADETESGKADDFLRLFGRSLGKLSRDLSPPDLRVSRAGTLLADTGPAPKGAAARRPFVHLVSTVLARRLEDWFAPFLRMTFDR
jgi:hypothetical protein